MKKNLFLTLGLLFAGVFSACSITPVETLPYLIAGDFVMESDSDDYSVCGLDLQFINQTEKEVSEFSIVFFLFDRDGEPASECSGRIAFDVEKVVDAGDSIKKCISLDKYMYTIPEESLLVDYLYVSRIVYADGSVWNDPYGLMAFK